MRVKVDGVSHAFEERKVLEDVNFEACSGEVIALMGPSGSGKTTLLSIIAGAARPDAGTVAYEPRDPQIAWIIQSTPLLSRRTAADNVALGALARGAGRAEADEVARDTLRRLDIGYSGRIPVFRLSGGERQRVGVARALAMGASIMLADEPTASLDPASRSSVVGSLRTAADAGALVIIATHDAAVAAQCDKRLVLDRATLIVVSGGDG